MKKFIDLLKNEFNSYSRNIKITLAVLFALVGLFIIFGIQILFWGLGYTDMSNLYPFGQWIIGDLGLVALGGGAFTTGFFLYIFRNDKLEPIINSTVLVGFLCYLFTFVFLVFDIGQPIRAWFGYTYPNWGPGLMPQSMLTEVVWCLTFYFLILCVELLPVALKHKVLDSIPFLKYTGHYLHKIMWIFAAAGTFLSFFHQGSLGGGMWGEMYAKPVWFDHFYFYVTIVGATAGGTSFMALIAYSAGKVMKKEVVPWETFQSITFISGIMSIVYLAFRAINVYRMASVFVPAVDRSFMDLWGGIYGFWMLVAEGLFAVAAIVLLVVKKFRSQERLMLAGMICAIMTSVMSKLIVVLHGSSTPNFPWRPFAEYAPSFQEWAVMLGGLACMALIYMWAAKYLPLFPHLHKHEHEEH